MIHTRAVRRSTLLAACLVAGVVSGCETPPKVEPAPTPAETTTAAPALPSDGSVTEVGGARITHADWAKLGYRWEWAGSPSLSRGGEVAFIDAYHDRVVVQETGSIISVLNPSSGAVVWAADLPGRASKLVGNVRVDDTLYCTTETDLFEMELGTGNLIDRYALPRVVSTVPAIFGKVAIFGSNAGEVVAFNRQYKLDVWRYDLKGPIESRPIAIDDRTVAVISQIGEVLFVDPTTGRAVGRNQISGGLANDPVTDGFRLFVASEDQSVYGFDAAGGARLWRHRTSNPLRTQPVLHDNVLYYSSADEGVTALNADTGEVVWNIKNLGNAWVVGVRDGNLVLWDGRFMTLVDPEYGEVVERAEMPGIRGVRTDKFVDGNLYAIAGPGTVLKFSPR